MNFLHGWLNVVLCYATQLQNSYNEYYHFTNIIKVYLKDVLKTFVNKLFYENFNITFIKNIKSCQRISFYFFSHIEFIKKHFVN